MVYFVCENARDKKLSMTFRCLYLQKKIRMKKTMFKKDMGFKKFTNVNISIKLHSVVCYSPNTCKYSILKVQLDNFIYCSRVGALVLLLLLLCIDLVTIETSALTCLT